MHHPKLAARLSLICSASSTAAANACKMLIQGARAALPTLSRSKTRIGQWLRGLLARAHSNTVVVALAAKMARIVWALPAVRQNVCAARLAI